ncbi:MAG: glutamate--tRNA ligase [Thermaerobacterales bacterium]
MAAQNQKVRVRFAPSPTGFLHVGGVRTALFNWLFARKNDGVFILRFEDTDLDRSKEELVQPMLDSIRWLGLDWQEGPEVGGDYGPYFQGLRIDSHREAADRLIAENKAYRCYCTVEELKVMRAEAQSVGRSFRYPGRCRELNEQQRAEREAKGMPSVIRLKTPAAGQVVVADIIHGDIAFPSDSFDDFIIIRSDGIPTYNFAVVVDDHHMRISHVIRAEEHLSNTPRQMLVYEALDYPLPQFAHVPMVLAPNRAKLSKRHGGVAVEEFREGGYLPEAILNYLALLGWSPGDGREIISIEEMVEAFSLERVSHTPAVYDVEKLTWMNGQYLRSTSLERVLEAAFPRLRAAGYVDFDDPTAAGTYLREAIDLVRQRVRTLHELIGGISYFFDEIDSYDRADVKKRFAKEGVEELLVEAVSRLEDLDTFNADELEQTYRTICEEQGTGTGKLFHATRLAISGRTVGPGLFDIMILLGRERCIKRLKAAVHYIRGMAEVR